MSILTCMKCFTIGHIALDCINQEKCSRCHGEGHRARDCSVDLYRITPTCLQCHQKGHKRSECPYRTPSINQIERRRRIDTMKWR